MELYRPLYTQLSRDEQKASLEALIFASEEPVMLDTLFKILIDTDDLPGKNKTDNDEVTDSETEEDKGFTPAYLEKLIEEINNELLETNRPFRIITIAGGYQYVTRQEYGRLLNQLIKVKSKRRLSQAALESLAIIAYKQPISKPEIEQIRGVNSNEIVNSLIEKNLVKIVGRSEGLGKSLLYGTTIDFLKTFGLNSLTELPKLRELEDFEDNDSASRSHIELTIDVSELPEIEDLHIKIED